MLQRVVLLIWCSYIVYDEARRRTRRERTSERSDVSTAVANSILTLNASYQLSSATSLLPFKRRNEAHLHLENGLISGIKRTYPRAVCYLGIHAVSLSEAHHTLFFAEYGCCIRRQETKTSAIARRCAWLSTSSMLTPLRVVQYSSNPCHGLPSSMEPGLFNAVIWL